ncbi:MAG: amino acid permease [Actinobacteria bacterium]|nr:amino acid permease [Actinomycetota bacterium]
MQKPQLRRALGVVNATAIALGAIIGAGIFVTISEAAGASGTLFLLAIPIAALVALLSGLSATELGIRFPRSGGTYEFGRRVLSYGTGFIAGWIFILAGITASSTYVLAFAGYLQPLIPGVSPQSVAAILALIATAANYFGVRFSAAINVSLVALKIILLLFFALAIAPAIRLGNILPIVPEDIAGLPRAVALLFFAYTGFARPVTLAEEIKRPESTLPASLLFALSISMFLYLATSLSAVGVLGDEELSKSVTPLSLAAGTAIGEAGTVIVSIGALVSIISVLLTEIFGLSRVIFAMSRNGDLPGWIGAIHPKYRVPHRAVILIGVVVASLSVLTDLSSVIAASSLALLLYYGLTNFTALRLGRNKIYSPAISLMGLATTLALSLALPAATIIINAIAIAIGLFYYYVIRPHLLRRY